MAIRSLYRILYIRSSSRYVPLPDCWRKLKHDPGYLL